MQTAHETSDSPNILILCTANSARSQMAEGLLRTMGHGSLNVSSAGTRMSFVHPDAIRVMAEFGIDIRQQTSKTLDRFLGQPFDAVITVCDSAASNCPFLPGQYRRLHWSFPDPAAHTDGPARLDAFRAVRDGLVRRFYALLAESWLLERQPRR